jgi:hypothetical protein
MSDKHLERVLFVVARRHCGKSTPLRSMFRDVRQGTAGEIPKDRKLKDFHRLMNERFLYLRLSSPHELKESPRVFLRKTKAKIDAAEPALCSHSPLIKSEKVVTISRPKRKRKSPGYVNKSIL